ncbi:MAG: cohesin domain-containing protein [Cyanobacteria bacterium J06560_6]
MKILASNLLSSGFVAGVLVLGSVSAAEAISLGIRPNSQEATLGNSVTADLVVSDLGNFTAPSVSVFDLGIDFDQSVLSFGTLDFGNELNLGFPSASIQSINTSAPGVVRFSEFSILPLIIGPNGFDTFQQSSITLGTLTFDTVGVGTSSLSLSANPILGDAIGDPLSIDVFSSGSISVLPVDPVSVPEPNSIWIPWLTLGFKRWLQRRRLPVTEAE